jgi:hypothetical protein
MPYFKCHPVGKQQYFAFGFWLRSKKPSC